MANVAVRGQPVEDPWLTWSVPEYGEGYWPVNDQQVSSSALAAASIPDMIGPKTIPYAQYSAASDPGVVRGLDPAVAELIATEELIAAELADKAPVNPVHRKPAHYGAASSWGEAAPSFTNTLTGWGLLVHDPEADKVRPTVRAGRALFGVGVVAGLFWGFVGGSW